MLLKDIYHMDSYQSFFEKGGWFNIGENLQSVLNALINLFFGLIKYLVLALDYVIDKLFNLNLLEGILPSLFSSASSIYLKLFSTLGILVFTFVIVMIVRDFFEKGIAKALTRLVVFLLIYFGSLAFFQEGATKIQQVNTISQNVQGQLVDLSSGTIDTIHTSNSDRLLGNTNQLDGTTKIRNLIFDEFVLKAYALLNFGKTDISVEQYNNYLVKSEETYDKDKSKDIEKKVKEDSDDNTYLTSDRMTEKVIVLTNTLIMLFVIGLAVLLIGLANVLVQLLIYALIFVFPSLLFLALIPNMHHLLKNGFMLLGTLFASKVALGFGFGLLFSILNLIDSFFVVTNIVTMLVGLFVKVLLVEFIWKNKGQIVRTLTKGQAELKDFRNQSGRNNPNRKQRREEKRLRNNRFDEQEYRTDTAENDYLRSEIELERAYKNDDIQDHILAQAGKEESDISNNEEDEAADVARKDPAKEEHNDTTEENTSRFSTEYPDDQDDLSNMETDDLTTSNEEVHEHLKEHSEVVIEDWQMRKDVTSKEEKIEKDQSTQESPDIISEEQAQQLEQELMELRNDYTEIEEDDPNEIN
ncbi:CD3337/EF1877 family mobilome membrane protein [Enterococcus termitis]|uniref:Uncharacterized protein n=1 Tax=Enterococcus termitis TaxID=332950 RepID=A0A1E5GKE8_9ENTE|nr:hypothetical protein [Enterococcus termitis]OEG13149.1 hypothetical protein BCR25_06585 [Enterococcus termitis]